KYIEDEENKVEYLFDLKNDPKEKINLFSEKKVILNKFREILKKHLQAKFESNEKSKILSVIKKKDFKII
ncbi:hypothetical protein LCGC14_1886650, partial [marine sediment metagenome]